MKYTNVHIYETAPPIYIKFVAKCLSLQPLSSEIKINLYKRIPLNSFSVATANKSVGNLRCIVINKVLFFSGKNCGLALLRVFDAGEIIKNNKVKVFPFSGHVLVGNLTGLYNYWLTRPLIIM